MLVRPVGNRAAFPGQSGSTPCSTLHFYANRYTLPCRSERGTDGFHTY
jgi:hypothetical protein